MNCPRAIPSTPDVRLETLASRLKAGGWVRDARVVAMDGAGVSGGAPALSVRVIPSDAGLRVLRCKGKAHLVAEWQRELPAAGLDRETDVEWRLVEELATSAAAGAELATRPDWMPVVSNVEIERDGQALSCRLQVPFDLRVFRGHFPSKPVVPGMLLVGWAVELARVHGLATGRCRGIGTAKFRRVVQPGMRLTAQLRCGPLPDELQFSYALGDVTVTTGRVLVEAQHG